MRNLTYVTVASLVLAIAFANTGVEEKSLLTVLVVGLPFIFWVGLREAGTSYRDMEARAGVKRNADPKWRKMKEEEKRREQHTEDALATGSWDNNRVLEAWRLNAAVIDCQGDDIARAASAAIQELERKVYELEQKVHDRDRTCAEQDRVHVKQLHHIARLEAKLVGEAKRTTKIVEIPDPFIAKNWRRLVSLCHPDHHGGSEASNAITRELLVRKPVGS
jgi:hypothetical protein